MPTISALAREESGIALLIAVVLMLMVSAIALQALNRARDEGVGSASSRRKVSTLVAADAMLALVKNQLMTSTTQFPDTNPIDEVDFIEYANGLATSVRTGTIANPTAQSIVKVGQTQREGSQLNVNAPNTFSYGVYRTGVVATDPSGGSVQLQAQFGFLIEQIVRCLGGEKHQCLVFHSAFRIERDRFEGLVPVV